jgi:hypothetical protein
MSGDLAAFTLLGDSADWLKDTGGVSIREYRLAAMDAYRAAWASPTSNSRFATLQVVFGRLFDALRHNQLYPEAVILGGSDDKTVRYLASPESLRKDFELLRNFCVVNKVGMGEIHLLYIALLFCRTLYQGQAGLRDEVMEEAVDNVLFLRLPIYRADNLGEFSTEVKARFHAVRIMYSMKKLGLFDDTVVHTIAAQDQAEARKLLANELSGDVERYIQKRHRLAFQVLDAATALEEYTRAHIAGRIPAGERTPEEIFLQLRHRLRHLVGHPEVTTAMQSRLVNLGVAGIVRALPHVDGALARDMYAFLRGGKRLSTVRHARMFEVLPNNAERLRFLNFLFLRGKQNPVYYVERFERFFPGGKLRFVRKEVGFAFESSSEASARPPTD